MVEGIIIKEGITIPPEELWETACRAGGPGGQHVNTTSSRVTLHWQIATTTALNPVLKARALTKLANRISQDGVIQISVATERSQHANRRIARERLAELVRSAIARQKKRIPTKIPRSVERRRLDNKNRRGDTKRLRRRPKHDD